MIRRFSAYCCVQCVQQYCGGPNNGNLGAGIFLLTWTIRETIWEGADIAVVSKNSLIVGSRMVKGCTSSNHLTVDLRMCIRIAHFPGCNFRCDDKNTLKLNLFAYELLQPYTLSGKSQRWVLVSRTATLTYLEVPRFSHYAST